MTLSGNLGFVPLDEVLRLLTRSGNHGMVEITNSTWSGRIFVADNGVGLATTLPDEGLRAHLISSGYITESELASVADGSARLAEYFTTESEGRSLLREMTIESIYQLDAAEADFQVIKDAASPYANPEAFDLESILADSRDRAVQWNEVSRAIPDLDATLCLNRSLERESIELNKNSWRIISELGAGASVRELSERLGTTDFAVARVAATMKEEDLLLVESGSVEPEGAPVNDFSTTLVEDSAPDKSWWDEPTDETPAVASDLVQEDLTEVDPVSQDLSEADPVGITSVFDEDTVPEPVTIGDDTPVGFDSDVEAPAEDDAEETEAFLEKVFSEVGSPEDEDGGHGLMRRRRMGSVLRELGED